MYPSKLGTTVAILAVTAGFSALVDSAHAQISGTIGGDVVDNGACQVLGDRSIALTDGNMAFQWGRGETTSRLTGTVHVIGSENARASAWASTATSDSTAVGRQSSNDNALGCLARRTGRAWIAPWFRE